MVRLRSQAATRAAAAALLGWNSILTCACSGGAERALPSEYPVFLEGGVAGKHGALLSGAAGGSGGTANGTPPGENTTGGTSWLLPRAGSNGTGSTPEPGCSSVSARAPIELRPVDIVFVIDNSSSMNDEIAAVQTRINTDFAAQIANSGLDYRVVMISRYGKVGVPVGESDNPICIAPPLGKSGCEDPAHTQLENGERFKHFSADIESHDALCALLGGFSESDEYADVARRGWRPLAPTGYSQYLRPEAFKHIVVISDDDVSCQFGSLELDDHSSAMGGEAVATAFDRALLKLSPAQFGTPEHRNYAFYSIVGLAENKDPVRAYAASEPITTSTCGSGSAGPGTGYQALSRLTSGLRYPSCRSQNFDAIFSALASGVVSQSRMACRFELPRRPDGLAFDPSELNVQFRASELAPPEEILHVSSSKACATTAGSSSEGWYYDDALAPTALQLCPATCARVEPQVAGQLDLLFGCHTHEAPR
ncbi:MAG TPA: hypothetical protein VFQ61_02705 [Polyangiaceae bacterium]|nr:hypothetical protein [Polyangiaceae bacterium]